MFASFMWMLNIFAVCRAGEVTIGDRLKTYQASGIEEQALVGADRRRAELDVHSMAAQAGFRYKACVNAAPIPGAKKILALSFAPAIMGELLNFELAPKSEDRRRWGFHKNNFVANVVDKLNLEDCDNVLEECHTVATEVYGGPLIPNTASLAQNYPFMTDYLRYFLDCAGAEIEGVCNDLKAQVC